MHEISYAYEKGGFRERYAITFGKRYSKEVNGHQLWVFRYGEDFEYQEANGATYDRTTKKWIN